MFTPGERDAVREALIERARADPDVTAAAVLGSGALAAEDRWSDLDLALRLRPDADHDQVVRRWTSAMITEHGAVDRLDVHAAGALYRVFLLASSLQVDLSFWPAETFRPHGPAFRLIFGEALPGDDPAPPEPERLIGLGWLYALHVRSALARCRTWQAVIMLDQLRDQLIQLACLRHDLPAHQGRGADRLPAPTLATLADARAGTVEAAELRRSGAALLRSLAAEAAAVDPALAERLVPVLTLLTPEEP